MPAQNDLPRADEQDGTDAGIGAALPPLPAMAELAAQRVALLRTVEDEAKYPPVMRFNLQYFAHEMRRAGNQRIVGRRAEFT